MLNPVAANSLARGHAQRTSRLGPGLALRAILLITASLYVLGPTMAQWVSFDQVRTEVAAERASQPPAVAVEEFVEPSPQLQTVLEDVAPNDAQVLIAPGLSALSSVDQAAGSLADALVASAIRAAQVAVVALAAIVLSIRLSTSSYKPRHGRGWMSVLLSRRS